MSAPLKHIETLIFDFDGTIADTLQLGVKISNQLATVYKYNTINTKEDLQLLQNQSTQEALKTIGVSLLKLPLVAASFRKKLTAQIHDVPLIAGIKDTIQFLAKTHSLGIVTSNSKRNIELFLKLNDLTDYITYYSTGNHLFKKSKTIKSLIKKNKLDKEKVLLIGDETRDIEAAKRCQLPIVSVCWGFHSFDLLKSYNPEYLIKEPKELQTLLTK